MENCCWLVWFWGNVDVFCIGFFWFVILRVECDFNSYFDDLLVDYFEEEIDVVVKWRWLRRLEYWFSFLRWMIFYNVVDIGILVVYIYF